MASMAEKAKLSAVLEQLDRTGDDQRPGLAKMKAWIKFRLRQIEALVSPQFIDISMRFATIDFAEPSEGEETKGFSEYTCYSRPAELSLWSLDNE
jgi:hypothetical protein